jgi:hypothetical protein
MALPSIPALEVLVAELIALILFILAGARLILHEWNSLKREKRPKRQTSRRRVIPNSSA